MPDTEEIAHQQTLLTINRRNLALLLEQERRQGGRAYALPVVVNGIAEARAEIARIKGILAGWRHPADDHPDDRAPAVPAPEAASPTPGNVTYNISGGTFNAPVSQSGGSSVSSQFNQPNWQVQGNVYNIAGDLNLGANPTKDEFLAALRQFKAELDKANDLPADRAEEINDDVDDAIKAMDKPAPNKARAGERLESVKNMLETTLAAAPSALALGQLVGQALAKLPGIGG